MPLTGTALRAQLADRTANPTRNVAVGSSPTTSGQIIDVQLILQGVAFNPEDVYDALVVKYGAGKVSSPRDTATRGQYQFLITP